MTVGASYDFSLVILILMDPAQWKLDRVDHTHYWQKQGGGGGDDRESSPIVAWLLKNFPVAEVPLRHSDPVGRVDRVLQRAVANMPAVIGGAACSQEETPKIDATNPTADGLNQNYENG